MDDGTDDRALVWCCASGALPDGLRAALADAQVTLVVARAGERRGPGLLWVDGPADAAGDQLRDLAGAGEAQVLAVVPAVPPPTNQAVWQLVTAGAADVLTWDGAARTAGAIAARLRRWIAIDRLLAAPAVRERLFGSSRTWLAALRQLVEAAAFTDVSILLMGESGVGKEEAARLVHALDARRCGRELVVVDCTTVVPELSGSEFFGHERGAFTGAATARDGAFALADGGTLFLDEVGELPPGLQAQLLRVIQERTFKRVGANVWARTDFRLVCATNRDLVGEVAAGRFRRDLYHRIAAWSCRLPPLRERAEDILGLALRFLRESLSPGQEPAFDPAVQEFLLRREYPGNVRDLRQLVFRLGKRHVGDGPISVGDIPTDELPGDVGRWPDAALDQAVALALAAGAGLKTISRAATEAAIRHAFRESEGNLQRAANRLGVTDRALQIRRAQRGDAS